MHPEVVLKEAGFEVGTPVKRKADNVLGTFGDIGMDMYAWTCIYIYICDLIDIQTNMQLNAYSPHRRCWR